MNLIDAFFPEVCGICEKINSNSVCYNCKEKLKKYEISSINRCNEDKWFDYAISMYRYESIIRNKIIEYKFSEKVYLHKTFSRLIINNRKICSFLKSYDIIIPVPMYKNKKYKRGYNQTELIARDIAKELNIELQKNNLIKIKDNKRQSTLTKEERIQNVKDVFNLLNVETIRNRKIILFDDIYTTGSTTNECAKLIKKTGAKEITVLTIAKD